MKKDRISYLKGEMPTSIQQIKKEYIFEYLSVKIAAKEITKEQLVKFTDAVEKANKENENPVTAFAHYRRTFCEMFEEFQPLLQKKKKQKMTDTEYFSKLQAGFKDE